jgi:outer membrane protein TolC
LEELERQSKDLLNAQIQTTIATVMEKYYDVVRQQSYLKTLNQSIAVSKQQLDIIEVKRNIGVANDADLFQAKIDFNTKQQDAQSQQLVIDQAKTDLLNYMSIRADSAITISDTIIIDNSMKLDDVVNAIATNPQVLSADDQIKINEQIEKETAALRYPSLRANAGLNYGRTQSAAGTLLLNQSYGPYIGLSVAVPIYNGGAYKRQEQAAKLTTNISKIQKESLALSYQAASIKMFQSYSNNLGQIATQQYTNELSAKLVDLTLQRFRLSQATILEVRAAQQSFEDAGYRLVNLSYAAKFAEIEMKRIENKLGL